jgi:hypothetical protein
MLSDRLYPAIPLGNLCYVVDSRTSLSVFLFSAIVYHFLMWVFEDDCVWIMTSYYIIKTLETRDLFEVLC